METHPDERGRIQSNVIVHGKEMTVAIGSHQSVVEIDGNSVVTSTRTMTAASGDASLPSSTSSAAAGRRTVFRRDQLEALEERFLVQSFLTREERIEFGQQIQLSDRQIMIWFQNRRGRLKKRGPTDKAFASKQLNDVTGPTARSRSFLAGLALGCRHVCDTNDESFSSNSSSCRTISCRPAAGHCNNAGPSYDSMTMMTMMMRRSAPGVVTSTEPAAAADEWYRKMRLRARAGGCPGNDVTDDGIKTTGIGLSTWFGGERDDGSEETHHGSTDNSRSHVSAAAQLQPPAGAPLDYHFVAERAGNNMVANCRGMPPDERSATVNECRRAIVPSLNVTCLSESAGSADASLLQLVTDATGKCCKSSSSSCAFCPSTDFNSIRQESGCMPWRNSATELDYWRNCNDSYYNYQQQHQQQQLCDKYRQQTCNELAYQRPNNYCWAPQNGSTIQQQQQQQGQQWRAQQQTGNSIYSWRP